MRPQVWIMQRTRPQDAVGPRWGRCVVRSEAAILRPQRWGSHLGGAVAPPRCAPQPPVPASEEVSRRRTAADRTPAPGGPQPRVHNAVPGRRGPNRRPSDVPGREASGDATRGWSGCVPAGTLARTPCVHRVRLRGPARLHRVCDIGSAIPRVCVPIVRSSHLCVPPGGPKREAHLPAEQPPPLPQARVPLAHAYQRRPFDHQRAAPSWPSQALGLTR
jgi:hypothetical protein